MNEDDYNNAVDETYDYEDGSSDLQESQLDQYEQYPSSPKATETLLTWFWKIVNLKDSTKVSNLDSTEIGPTVSTVRGLQRLALVSEALGESSVTQYFKDEAEIVLATAMSRKGWLVEQSISQKKNITRARQRTLGNSKPWRPFQKKETSPEGQ